MLDLKFIRENPDSIRTMLEQRKMTASLDQLLEIDRQWRTAVAEVETFRNHQNTVSKKIAELKRSKQDSSELISEMKGLSQNIKRLGEQANLYKKQVDDILLTIPNFPHLSTPVGSSEEDNADVLD